MIKNLKLSTTLILLQLLAFIPFILVFIHSSIRESQNLLQHKRHDILNEVNFVARSENSVGTIYFLLKTLSADPSIKKFDKKEIQEHFESLLKGPPLFHNIALLDKAGYGLISGKKMDKLPSASDRLYFKRALEKKDFVWGEFAISRTTGKPTIHFAMPVLDDDNNILYVIVAVPIMEQVLPKYDKLLYPAFILDANGVVVKSKDDQRVGEKYELYEKIIKTAKNDGFLKLKDHYIFFSKLNINNGHLLTLVMEVPLSIVSLLADSGFFYEIFIIFSIFLFLIYLTNKVSNNLIIKPLKTVQKALRSFTGDTPLQKIEQEFPSDFEIFRETYNTFIDNIKEKNKELEQERNFWLNVFNDIPDPIFLVDSNYKINMANESFFKTFKISKEETKDLHCYEICHKTKSPIDFCPHKEVMEKNIYSSMEAFFPDLGKWFLITFTKLTSSQYSDGTLHVFKDITEIKKKEEEKLHIQQQLLHTQKLESLGILAGGIAHDFNNLLMGILGNAELALMKKEELPSSATQNIEAIKKITEKAAHLTKQMLAYAGKGKFVLKEIDINAFIREIFDLIKVSLSKKVTISLNLNDKEPLIIIADPGQIEQIILNLVINANEAMEDKEGLITITTGKQFCDKKYFENSVDGDIRFLKEGEYVYFEVSDNGCGMDRETMDRIFEPFFTTKFQGRGLGLSAILGIVRGHNGAIRVYSEMDRGSSFKILFPAIKQEPIKIKENYKYNNKNFSSKTFLIIDDEEIITTVTKNIVELLGGKAITFNSGPQAIEFFKTRSNEIDYVLLDLSMPELSGDEVFRELKKIKEDVQVILMSGYNDQETSQRLVGRGFAGFLQKPFNINKLFEILSKL